MVDFQYKRLLVDVLYNGEWAPNRTGVPTLYKIGAYLKIDCSQYVPLLTIKKVLWKSAFSEMIGFIRGYTNASDFRNIGCNVWNKNANETKQWLDNPNRKGIDDLGKIYGFQWRNWQNYNNTKNDQLKSVIDDLSNNIDNRRELVLGWNPSELNEMCLPPCHLLMQFSLVNNKKTIDLNVYQRSWDLFLGAPFNLAQYGFLLNLIAKITNKQPGTLHYFAGNVHIYENHIDQVKTIINREPKNKKPYILINDKVNSLSFIESNLFTIGDHVVIKDYDPHPLVKAPMAT